MHDERQRWVGAEWHKVWGGCPLPSRLRGLGSVMSSLSEVWDRASAENGFWHILKATERSFLYLYDQIWGRGAICIRVPYSKFWGTCPPSPVIYTHGQGVGRRGLTGTVTGRFWLCDIISFYNFMTTTNGDGDVRNNWNMSMLVIALHCKRLTFTSCVCIYMHPVCMSVRLLAHKQRVYILL